jgi:hypothetical protein
MIAVPGHCVRALQGLCWASLWNENPKVAVQQLQQQYMKRYHKG